ncbi:MAG: alpha-E domain-containing protein [Burkholderiaceae bacterium]
MDSLLSRYAENSFWLARYLERAENLARLLDITESFARNSDGGADWESVVHLHGDMPKFLERYKKVTPAGVVRFYVIDRQNPDSIAGALTMARDNARTLRHLLSQELWTQLNVFANWVFSLKPRDLSLHQLSALCARLKEGCQLHRGIAQNTLYRDQLWYFYRLGRSVERCDQTTRVLDIKIHSLITQGRDPAQDASEWNALLRATAAYHGYRRVHPRGIDPHSVTQFLLADGRFPRSTQYCINEARKALGDLAAQPDMQGRAMPLQPLQELEAMLAEAPAALDAKAMHDYLDRLQVGVVRFSEALAEQFFGHA